jgi:2-methylcitrate synthase/citrate synthase II
MSATTPPNVPSAAPLPYSPGLAGVIAGESAISAVDGEAGLLYRGYDIHELAIRASFEEVIFLLLHGELPDGSQLEKTREQLAADAPLPGAVRSMLRLMPPRAHPIDVLRTGMSMLASFDSDLHDNSHAANLRKAMRIIARTSTMITASHRVASGQEPFSPGEHRTFAARFLFGMTGKEPEPWRSGAMNLILTLYAEHEFNASTFAARVTASTLSDIYAAVVSALGTLKGPLHGGANEEAMKMIRDIGSPDRVEPWVKEHLARHDKIMGFGHRVYKKGDSRAPAMRDLARELARRSGHEQMIDVCMKLEEVMVKEKGLYANLDLYAAPALNLLGIPPELDVPVFAAARVAGWCAHVIEQHDHNRLIRPRSIYTGPPRRAYPVGR